MGKQSFDPDEPRASTNGDAELEDTPLAERLRNLSWPTTDEPDHAQRSWERFQERMAELRQGAEDEKS